MTDKLVIDGVEYDVPIVDLQRSADILDKTANRSEDGVLHREVIGTYHNYTLKISHVRDMQLYNELFSVLSAPVASHMIEMPDDHVTFEAYVSSIKDKIIRVYANEGAKYGELSCKFTAMEPRRRA